MKLQELDLLQLLVEHGTVNAVAAHTGMSERALRRRLQRIKDRGGALIPAEGQRAVPLSEDNRKFHADWTAEDCIKELQRVANIDTKRVVSRNYFRNESTISESTWNRFFGTFHEYKRQANIVLTRQVHALEQNIAKHASVDHYRALNAERGQYEGKYARPSGGRFKTCLILNDLHDIECDPFYLEVAIDVARRLQPNYVNYNGDIFDLPEFGRYGVDPRQWDVTGRIRFVHDKIFAPMRDATPGSQFDLVEGNHEFRLMRHLADATPAMRAVLSDLHGMSVATLLGLDQFEINYIAKADLAAYTLANLKAEIARNFKVYDDLLLCHHFPEGRRMGMPGVNGHHHKHTVWAEHNHTFGSYNWIQAGAGHISDAVYCNGEKWQQGFTIAHMDTLKRRVNFEYVDISDFAVAGGKYYVRSET